MKLLTPRIKAANVPSLWAQVHGISVPAVYYKPSADKEAVHSRLVALGDSPDPLDVNRIIGNSGWTDCVCSECGNAREAVIQFGEEPDYDTSTVWICLDCLRKAQELIAEANETPAAEATG